MFMMNENECFRLALVEYLKKEGRGSLTVLSVASGFSLPFISQISSGARNASVAAMTLISDAIGVTYTDMLSRGRMILSASSDGKPDSPPATPAATVDSQPKDLGRRSYDKADAERIEKVKQIFLFGDEAAKSVLRRVSANAWQTTQRTARGLISRRAAGISSPQSMQIPGSLWSCLTTCTWA